MLKKIIFTLFLSNSLYASEVLVYSDNSKNSLDGFFSSKKTELLKDLYIDLDLGSALVFLDADLANDISKNSPKRLNPDKTLVTLSYKF